MDLGVLEIGTNPGHEDIDLVDRPSEDTGEGGQDEGLQALLNLQEVPGAELFEFLVLGPGPEGQLDDLLRYVDEAGVEHPLLERGAGDGGAARLLARLEETLVELQQCRVAERVVVREVPEVPVEELDVATRFGVSKGGGGKEWVSVLDGTR